MNPVALGFEPGYLVYLAAVMVPGYGIGELFGRWDKDDGAAQRLGSSLGYGIALMTLVFAARTLGVRLGPVDLVGVGPSVVYAILAAGIAMVVASAALRRRLTPFRKPTWTDATVSLCALLIGLIAFLYFQKFPIFPAFYNPDYLALVRQPSYLIGGSLVTVPRLILYGAGTYQTAATFLVVGAFTLKTAQLGMTILAILSPFLVYSIALRLFKTGRGAVFCTLIYTLTGTIWVAMLYSDGLYPNFVGVLLQLTLVGAFMDLAASPKRAPAWVVSGLVVFAAYFAHYSVLALLGSFAVVVALFASLRAKEARGMAIASALFLAPGVIGALVFRSTIIRDLTISYNSGGAQPLTTPLARALSFAPSVAYLAFVTDNDFGFVAMLALVSVALYYGFKSRNTGVMIAAVWFFGLLLASPQDYAAWRFSLEAVLPMTLLAGYGLDSLIPKRPLKKTKRLRAGDPYRFGVIVIPLLFFIPMVVPGWTSGFAGPLVQSQGAVANIQTQELDAMNWLGQNTNSTTTSLTITDPSFLYSPLFIGRNCSFAFFLNETQVTTYAQQNGYSYLIVTRYNVFDHVYSQVPDSSSTELPWFTYKSTAGATLVYNSSDVRIFHVEAPK